jgi:hypothetical protein
MWSKVRVSVAAIGISAFLSILGGCNDDSSDASGAAPSGTSTSTPAALTISGRPAQTAIAGQKYVFVPTVRGGKGTTLQFEVVNPPAWASLDVATGQFGGTPSPSDTRVYGNILIKVVSGGEEAALRAFSIQVVAPAASPAMSGTVQIAGVPGVTVTAGSAYRFQPDVVVPDGATATYSVTNLPPWAQFDAATGVLSGTPEASQAGLYADIVISVTADGDTAALAPFSINVSSGSSTVATVTWAPPSGATASQVSGYRVYYGTSVATMTKSVDVPDSSATSYVIDNLSSGTWYFAIASYDASKDQSPLSPVVEVTL